MMNNGRYWSFGSAGRDRMVERYVEGRMSDMELARFQTLLESDPKLRRMVETERSIRSTLLRDRNRLPHDDPRGRAQLLAMLASASAEPMTAGTAPAGAAGHGTSWLAGGLMKGIAVAVVGTSLTVGAYFGLQAIDNDRESAPPAVQIQQQQNGAQASEAPAQAQPTTAAPSVVQQPTAQPLAPATPTTEPQLHQRRSVMAAPPANVTPSVAITSSSDSATAPAVVEPPVQSTPKRAPVVLIPDTMRVEVKIEMED